MKGAPAVAPLKERLTALCVLLCLLCYCCLAGPGLCLPLALLARFSQGLLMLIPRLCCVVGLIHALSVFFLAHALTDPWLAASAKHQAR
jgi:hypothetical protein